MTISNIYKLNKKYAIAMELNLYDNKNKLSYIIKENKIEIKSKDNTFCLLDIIQRENESGTEFINFKGPNSIYESIEIGAQIIHIRYVGDIEKPESIDILESKLTKINQ